MPKAIKEASKKAPVKLAPKRKAGKYLMPDPLPNGLILKDNCGKEWKLGTSIGKGGFGEIYSATDVASGKNSYVIKIEPKENGPLFVEMHFFMKVCKSQDIDKYIKSKNLQFLGLPRSMGHGTHEHNDKAYRFVVMEKYGRNLDAVLKENKNVLRSDRIFQIALQIIDVLEYIHSKGYIHADVKGGNLLFGLKKGTEDKVYVIDFGLASRYTSDFKPDPKCAHNGTIEFTSRDAHVGAKTRRGDLEILAYNVLRWFTARLPWEDKLTDCSYVQQQKIKYMKDIPGLMKECFGSRPIPEALRKYFEYISNMPPAESPDYDLCRRLFQEGYKKQVIPEGKECKVTLSPLRNVNAGFQNLKIPENENTTIQENRKVERRQKSPLKVEKQKSSIKDKVQNISSKARKQKSPAKVQIEKSPEKETRSVRAVRKMNHVANGYVPESDSFSESDDKDDEDYKTEGGKHYKSKNTTTKKKAVKRQSNEKNIASPKKKKSQE